MMRNKNEVSPNVLPQKKPFPYDINIPGKEENPLAVSNSGNQ